MGMGMVWMVLLWLGLIAVAVWLVLRLFPQRGRQSNEGKPAELSAMGILDRRFARGEISVDEYETMKKALSGGPHGQSAIQGGEG